MPLVENYAHHDDWDALPETTGIDVLADPASGLGTAFGSTGRGHLLFGFAQHASTTYLGSSTGLRRREVRRPGISSWNAKMASDLTAPAWAGRATRDFYDVDVAEAEASTGLGWARTKIELPPGRYETLLPLSAVADLLIYTYWTANARDAEEGRNVFAAGDGKSRIGQSLTPLPVTMRSDPGYPDRETVPFVRSPHTEDETS